MARSPLLDPFFLFHIFMTVTHARLVDRHWSQIAPFDFRHLSCFDDSHQTRAIKSGYHADLLQSRIRRLLPA